MGDHEGFRHEMQSLTSHIGNITLQIELRSYTATERLDLPSARRPSHAQ